MQLTEDERRSIASVRIERAYKTLADAKAIVAAGMWNAAANRLYYACYYMVSALLVNKGFEASTHSGVIRMFSLNFVKEGFVSDEMGRFYSKLFELRQTGDYADWVYLTEEDVAPLVPKVEEFMDTIKGLI